MVAVSLYQQIKVSIPVSSYLRQVNRQRRYYNFSGVLLIDMFTSRLHTVYLLRCLIVRTVHACSGIFAFFCIHIFSCILRVKTKMIMMVMFYITYQVQAQLIYQLIPYIFTVVLRRQVYALENRCLSIPDFLDVQKCPQ